MRYLAALLALVALPAFAAFDITATMPATAGATSCQLYLDGQAAGSPKPCGSAQGYPGLIASPGKHAFAYKAVNASGESALSPETTVSIAVIPPPTDPTGPPTISVACDPAPCPATLTITISP